MEKSTPEENKRERMFFSTLFLIYFIVVSVITIAIMQPTWHSAANTAQLATHVSLVVLTIAAIVVVAVNVARIKRVFSA